jgi:hypothetical protein
MFITFDWERLNSSSSTTSTTTTSYDTYDTYSNSYDYNYDTTASTNSAAADDTTASSPANPFYVFLFSMMIIYYVIAIFYCYRIYNHYKKLFIEQIGDIYNDGGYGHHDDYEEQRYQEQ